MYTEEVYKQELIKWRTLRLDIHNPEHLKYWNDFAKQHPNVFAEDYRQCYKQTNGEVYFIPVKLAKIMLHLHSLQTVKNINAKELYEHILTYFGMLEAGHVCNLNFSTQSETEKPLYPKSFTSFTIK